MPAWVAGKCNCFAGKGLTEGEERTIPDIAHKAKVRELEAWGHFRASSPVKSGWLTRVGCSPGKRPQMISRPGSASGQCGYCRLRNPQILSFGGGIPGGPAEMAA